MERRALVMSLALHGAILALMFCDFSFSREYSKPPAVIMHIDLNKVQIADKTNLPQKGIVQKASKVIPPKQEKQKPSKVISKKQETPKSKKEMKVVSSEKKVVKAPKPQPQPKLPPVPKEAVIVQGKKEKKSENVIFSQKQAQQAHEEEADLKSLLATVDKVRQPPVKKEKTSPQESSGGGGMSGGLEGRLDQMMTISDKDFISSKLRESWNLDGGTDRLDEIVVEVYVSLNKDGSLRLVKYTNKMNIPAFVQVAESAVRAVHIAANKGSESPFKILAEKYASHYSDWKEISLRFSPTEGIF